MNYIKHLTTFYERVANDSAITPFHISLYLALFQVWNAQRFRNPLNSDRFELLKLSKIGSSHTYYKCLKELHSWNYIRYIPSKSSTIASTFYLCIFDTSNAQAVHHTSSKNDTCATQAVHPIYKTYINNINKERETAPAKIQNFIIPNQKEVEVFFKSENFPSLEAQKFFNHFQSVGWRSGGKNLISDWQAAARKWMLNDLNAPKKPSATKLNPDKNYSEPL